MLRMPTSDDPHLLSSGEPRCVRMKWEPIWGGPQLLRVDFRLTPTPWRYLTLVKKFVGGGHISVSQQIQLLFQAYLVSSVPSVLGNGLVDIDVYLTETNNRGQDFGRLAARGY